MYIYSPLQYSYAKLDMQLKIWVMVPLHSYTVIYCKSIINACSDIAELTLYVVHTWYTDIYIYRRCSWWTENFHYYSVTSNILLQWKNVEELSSSTVAIGSSMIDSPYTDIV